jgi:hypothetical protein
MWTWHTNRSGTLLATLGLLASLLGGLAGPVANADNLTASSAEPTVSFQDTNTVEVMWDIIVDGRVLRIRDWEPVGPIRTAITLNGSANSASSLVLDQSGNIALADNALFIDRALARVGIDTTAPQGNLHINGTATQDLFSGIGPDLAAGPAFNFGYAGSSFGRSSGFFNVRPDALATPPNPSLRFATANVQRMIITNTGNVGIGTLAPTNPLQMGSGARVTAGGVWTDASSREYKQEIEPLAADIARATLDGLVPVTFAYKADPAEHHVGFVAEDVPALVATPDRKGLSPMDIVAVLTRVVQEQQRLVQGQQRAMQEYQAGLAELRAELAALRKTTGR